MSGGMDASGLRARGGEFLGTRPGARHSLVASGQGNSRILEFTFHNRLNAGSCDDDDASAGHLYTDIQIPDLTASLLCSPCSGDQGDM